MKRSRLFSLAALTICALLWCAPAQASSLYKGEKTLGVAAGYASYNGGAYTSVFFQYTFVPHVRISPEVGYVFRHDHKSGTVISCDMQFPFRIVRGFNVYPLAGLTFNSWNHSEGGNANRFGGEAGAGFDLYITSNFKIDVKGKYSFMKDTSGAFVGVGLGYVF